jgi:hypothetical protein
LTSGSGKGSDAEPTLEELRQTLNLKGEEIGGLFVAKEQVEELRESTKWMAVMKVLSSKPFIATSLKKTMLFAWAPAKEIWFQDLEENCFMIQVNCLAENHRTGS